MFESLKMAIFRSCTRMLKRRSFTRFWNFVSEMVSHLSFLSFLCLKLDILPREWTISIPRYTEYVPRNMEEVVYTLRRGYQLLYST